MLLSQLHPKKGFTLIEMMIVIAIIMMLLGLVLFPYSYYMQRAYVENTGDTIAQGWILAHKDVRNGKLFDIGTTANKLLIFRKGSREVEQYLLSGSVIPELTLIESNPDVKKEKSILSDSDVQILGFSGTNLSDEDILGYMIQAPQGDGVFFTGARLPFSSSGVFLTIGYDGAELSSGRARQILLRTYLQ